MVPFMGPGYIGRKIPVLLYKGLKGKASIPTDDLVPLVRYAGMIIIWHIRFPLLTLIFISVAFSTQTIRDWIALTDSLISSAEGAEDGFAKFFSLVRARD